MTAYEQRFQLPVQRPVRVEAVRHEEDGLLVASDHGDYLAHAVVSATGSLRKPFVPHYPGLEQFQGEQIHSAQYGEH